MSACQPEVASIDDAFVDEMDDLLSVKQDIVFSCSHCAKDIVRDSREHDECIVRDNDWWFCGDCHEYAGNCFSDESDPESCEEVIDNACRIGVSVEEYKATLAE